MPRGSAPKGGKEYKSRKDYDSDGSGSIGDPTSRQLDSRIKTRTPRRDADAIQRFYARDMQSADARAANAKARARQTTDGAN